MEKLVLCAITLLLVSFVPPASLAQNGWWSNDAPPTIEVRRAFAKQCTSTFTELDRQIPTLSPSQQRWLQTEYYDRIASAGNRVTRRALAARSSTEYQVSIAKPRTSKIINACNKIAAGEIRDRNEEVALWTSIVSWFIDYQYWQAIGNLVEQGMIQNKIGYLDSYYFENYTLQAETILSKVVIPYLQGRLP